MSTTFVQGVILSALLLPSSTATNILIVGDSMGAIMETKLETVCSGSKVCNAAISGTTAAQWATGTFNDKTVKKCSGEPDVVYISVGGNDSLGSDCSMTSSELASSIKEAVKNIMNIAPGASKYLLTGYCVPRESPNKGCANPSDVLVIRDALASVDTELGASVEVIDSSFACGGSATSFSDDVYFEDSIHMNILGYVKVFTQEDIQRSMKCGKWGVIHDTEPATTSQPKINDKDPSNTFKTDDPNPSNAVDSSFLVMTTIAIVTFSTIFDVAL